MRRLGPLLAAATVALLAGCPAGGAIDDTTDADVSTDTPVVVAEPVPGADCDNYDAGDSAWVQRVTPLLLGRLPEGSREVRVLADLAAATDRATVARALMEQPEFIDRWTRWFLDELQVNRIGPKEHRSCFGVANVPEDRGDLSAHVAASDPMDPAWDGGPFTMLDLIRSSLWADNLSTLYRAELFAMMARPATFCGNTPDEEMEATRRREFGAKFAPRYTHRTLECIGCHNSVWSTTDHPDPALDRFWPLPGLLEAAMYRTETGAPDLELFSAFRLRGVLSKESLLDPTEADEWDEDAAQAVSPWGIDPACGQFVPPDAVDSDPLGYSSYLAGEIGDRATIWDVEQHLHQGLEILANDGPTWGPSDAVDGAPAFAYLLAQRLATRVWQAMMGAPLTLGHGFARNTDQHSQLLALTETVISSGWSLRQLLIAVVTDPGFNPPHPDSCPAEQAYDLPPVLTPFSVEETDPLRQGNGAGDLARRDAAWVLLDKTALALGWPTHDSFPDDEEDTNETVRFRAAGAFLSDGEPGFAGIDFQSRTDWEILTRDCLPSYQQESDSADWITEIVQLGVEQQAPMRDIAEAIRDRLLLSPTLDELESDLVADLLEVGFLGLASSQLGNAELPLRRYCGILLSSPWYLLAGVVQRPSETFPTLVLPGDDYRALCEQHAAALEATTGTSVVCGDDGVSVPGAPDG